MIAFDLLAGQFAIELNSVISQTWNKSKQINATK
jgi:hypothetical protein